MKWKSYSVLIALVFLCANRLFAQPSSFQPNALAWSLVLHQPNQLPKVVTKLPNLSQPFQLEKTIGNIKLRFSLMPKGNFTVFKAEASCAHPALVYFSLRGQYKNGQPYNFNGEVTGNEIYRQSPHDLDAWIVKTIPEQAVPVVALRHDRGFDFALSGSPALYDNFTSQEFFADNRSIVLSSGDSGLSPGLKPDTSKVLNLDYNAENGQKFTPGRVVQHYHTINFSQNHLFEGIIAHSTAQNLKGLRRDVNQLAALHFSGGKIQNYFGALAFTTAYMNLRRNDSGKSKYWVVPSVEYANVQYGRDAFWIATMLPPEYDLECLNNELQALNPFAEYPLFAVIWAYRAFKNKRSVDLSKVQTYVDEIERRAKDNCYHSYDERTGRLDFQYWGDLMAFEKGDVISFNQGLFALAIQAAKEMGLHHQSEPEAAAEQYRQQFNPTLGFFPISRLKNTVLGPDPLAPDLLAQIYFGKPLLETAKVKQHFYHMHQHARTAYGYKVISASDGSFLPNAGYDVQGYKSQANREGVVDGQYFRGGSYFLYDNLFLMDAYLHGVPEAEAELIWRIGLDFKAGNTTYECLNTLNGEPWKPNMGWNVAIYSFWQKLVDEGRADQKLFDAINTIAKAQE